MGTRALYVATCDRSRTEAIYEANDGSALDREWARVSSGGVSSPHGHSPVRVETVCSCCLTRAECEQLLATWGPK
jgi:hypothetical protein